MPMGELLLPPGFTSIAHCNDSPTLAVEEARAVHPAIRKLECNPARPLGSIGVDVVASFLFFTFALHKIPSRRSDGPFLDFEE
jgi:hypothetical protein